MSVGIPLGALVELYSICLSLLAPGFLESACFGPLSELFRGTDVDVSSCGTNPF